MRGFNPNTKLSRNELKVKIENTEFIVNGPATICRITYNVEVDDDILYLISGTPLNNIWVEQYAVGKAMRHEHDADNEALGRHIAESRAKAKIYKWVKRYTDELVMFANKAQSKSQQANEKFDHLYNQELKHIEKLIKES